MATPAGTERKDSMDGGDCFPTEGGQPPAITSTEPNDTGMPPPPSTENPDVTAALETE